MDPLVIILAAGESKRFLDKGFKIPKPLLRIEYMGDTMSMLAHVQSNIPEGLDILTVLREGMYPPDDIRGEVIHIAETRGQAESLYRVISVMREDRPILVHDCDMLLDVLDIHKLLDMLDHYPVTVAVTETFDPNASRVDKIPYPDIFVEKQPISQWGIVGARGFASHKELTQCIEIELRRNINTVDYEPYLSEAMNHFGGQPYALQITDYVDWGTPERILESGARIVGGVA
jgi:hypothetical protein